MGQHHNEDQPDLLRMVMGDLGQWDLLEHLHNHILRKTTPTSDAALRRVRDMDQDRVDLRMVAMVLLQGV